MTFDGKPITYTRENAAEQDKTLPDLHALSIKSVVSENGISGLDGIDIALVHGKRNTYVNADDFLETGGDKKDYTHGDEKLICEGSTSEQIDHNYSRTVGEDTWKTNKGDTILHYVGEMSEVHTADRHLEEPETVFERMNNKLGWGVMRADTWWVSYNLIATVSTTSFLWNSDFRLIDTCHKLAVSEHIQAHFADKEADAEVKGVENTTTVGKSEVKPASLQVGAVKGNEVALTQNIATVGENSNL